MLIWYIRKAIDNKTGNTLKPILQMNKKYYGLENHSKTGHVKIMFRHA